MDPPCYTNRPTPRRIHPLILIKYTRGDGVPDLSVPVTVMDVVDVGMAMRHRVVTVPVGMGGLRELLGRMLVLMVLVMDVLVSVLQSLVLMEMFMPIRREQEGADGHGGEREQAPNHKAFVQQDQREDRGETRREREQHPRVNHAQVSEPPHE